MSVEDELESSLGYLSRAPLSGDASANLSGYSLQEPGLEVMSVHSSVPLYHLV